jgi:pyrimidine operon attenuation protein/uracil phosphoribosyltransferase
VRADFVGKNIPTAKNETVEVRLEDTDGKDEVVIVSKEE